MTDSPAVQAPLDPKEAPILDHVLVLRDRLFLLKQDKSTYIKSHDVLVLYDEVIDQVHLLNTIRQEHGKPLEQNRGSSAVPSQKQVLESRVNSCSGQRVGRLFPIDITIFLDYWA